MHDRASSSSAASTTAGTRVSSATEIPDHETRHVTLRRCPRPHECPVCRQDSRVSPCVHGAGTVPFQGAGRGLAKPRHDTYLQAPERGTSPLAQVFRVALPS